VVLKVTSHEESRSLDSGDVAVPEIKTDFIESIRTGSDTLVTALDARNALAVVEAAYASLRDGGRVAVNWREE
jgi:predicted dehydrogenase